MYENVYATPTTYTVDIEHAYELAVLEDANRDLRAYGQKMAARVLEAENRQISADSHQLTDFWELAHRHAENAGYCEVYDRLVEAVGGPSREIEVVLEVTYRIETTMTRTEYADGDHDWESLVSNYVDLNDPWRTDSWTA